MCKQKIHEIIASEPAFASRTPKLGKNVYVPMRASSVTYLSPPPALLLPRRARRTIAISRETTRFFSLFSRLAPSHLFFVRALISNGQTTIQLSGARRGPARNALPPPAKPGSSPPRLPRSTRPVRVIISTNYRFIGNVNDDNAVSHYEVRVRNHTPTLEDNRTSSVPPSDL